MRGRNPDITNVHEIVVVTRFPSITQSAGGIIDASYTGSKSLLHLTSSDRCVCNRPPHPLYVSIFSVRDRPEPADVFLEFCQCEVADLRG